MRAGNIAAAAFVFFEGAKLRAGRQFAVPHQIGHFFEPAVFSEVLHRISAIGQRIGFRHNLGDRGRVDRDPGKSFVDHGLRRLRLFRALLRCRSHYISP